MDEHNESEEEEDGFDYGTNLSNFSRKDVDKLDAYVDIGTPEGERQDT